MPKEEWSSLDKKYKGCKMSIRMTKRMGTGTKSQTPAGAKQFFKQFILKKKENKLYYLLS